MKESSCIAKFPLAVRWFQTPVLKYGKLRHYKHPLTLWRRRCLMTVGENTYFVFTYFNIPFTFYL